MLPPSKKIFIGGSSLVAGIAFQFFLSYLAAQLGKDLATVAKGAFGGNLEQQTANMQRLTNSFLISACFMGVGLLFLLVGTYQTARRVEQLTQEKLTPRE